MKIALIKSSYPLHDNLKLITIFIILQDILGNTQENSMKDHGLCFFIKHCVRLIVLMLEMVMKLNFVFKILACFCTLRNLIKSEKWK